MPRLYGRQILQDPVFLGQEVEERRKSSLFDVHLKADKMMVHGFSQLRLTYIRVIRHFGVRT